MILHPSLYFGIILHRKNKTHLKQRKLIKIVIVFVINTFIVNHTEARFLLSKHVLHKSSKDYLKKKKLKWSMSNLIFWSKNLLISSVKTRIEELNRFVALTPKKRTIFISLYSSKITEIYIYIFSIRMENKKK